MTVQAHDNEYQINVKHSGEVEAYPFEWRALTPVGFAPLADAWRREVIDEGTAASEGDAFEQARRAVEAHRFSRKFGERIEWL